MTFLNNKEKEDDQLSDLNLEVGDIVEAFGVRGTVTAIADTLAYPIRVVFEHERLDEAEGFYRDGRHEWWHKTPSLKLIEKKNKPKRKVKLYRYTLDYAGIGITQSNWTEQHMDVFKSDKVSVLKTEEKEIEVDE